MREDDLASIKRQPPAWPLRGDTEIAEATIGRRQLSHPRSNQNPPGCGKEPPTQTTRIAPVAPGEPGVGQHVALGVGEKVSGFGELALED